jgi:dihydrofolate reductase
VIGRGNALPWHLPADLRRFKALTLGKPVIMGRHTHESIGRSLPGRRNIVISRGKPQLAAGAELAAGLDEALALVAGVAEVMVIGGAQVYRAALVRAQRIYLTRVHAVVTGDALFPVLDPARWRVVASSEHPADEANSVATTFTLLEHVAARGAP